jgi:hypothetical protein
MAPEKSESKVLVFYSYSHKDERYRNQLSVSLSTLRRAGAIEEWYDRRITAGNQWADEIAQQLDAAQLILLLVSLDFIGSDYCYGKEMTRALERNNEGEARVIPIIVRPCEISGTPFAKLQALPTDAKPVTIWTNRDKAWLNVLQGISQVVKEISVGIGSKQTSGGSSIVRSADEAPTTSRAAKDKPKKGKSAKRSKRAKSARSLTIGAVNKLGERVAARPGGQLKRTIYDAQNTQTLPGKIARREGKPPKGDSAVDEAYEWLGITYHFFWDVFKRNSWDGKGMPLEATVHYDKNFNNAFWNGKHIIIGDGDKKLFNHFTLLDVIAHEFTFGIVQTDTKLQYWGQSGALYNSITWIFGVLVKQYALKQTADKADWLAAAGVFASGVKGKALLSLAAPGTAYNDKALGKDPQTKHMREYVRTSEDSGGLHINAGIPNHAFYQVAMALRGFAWESAGRIWYDSMRDKQLKPDATFRDFARLTVLHARKFYGTKSKEVRAVQRGWEKVGIKTAR